MQVLGVGELLKSQRLVIQITHRCVGNNPKGRRGRQACIGSEFSENPVTIALPVRYEDASHSCRGGGIWFAACHYFCVAGPNAEVAAGSFPRRVICGHLMV
jgi:hypothetical protein